MHKPTVINWGPVIFLVTYQTALLAYLPFYFYFHTVSFSVALTAFFLLYLTGLSITGGYHRYYSHRSYKAGNFVEGVLLFLGAITAQGSALRWSFDHRLHHAHVDTDNDPYSIKKGFLYAHCTWIFEKPKKIEQKIVSDLFKNKLVMFQHKYYKPIMILGNALVTLFFGWVFNDFLGAFVLICALRMFLLHHFTWFINSLAHIWGDKPFSQELSAVDNYVLSILTFGEGYHNYHHTFANDYRNGIRWFHFDPTKWLIWTLHKLGLAYNLKRVDSMTIQKRMVIESKSLMIEQIKKTCSDKTDELEKIIQEMSDSIVEKLGKLNQLKEEYMELINNQMPKDLIKELQQEVKTLKRSLRHDWHQWVLLSKNIRLLA